MGPGRGRGQVADKRVVRFRQRLWPGRREVRSRQEVGKTVVRSRQRSWAGGRQKRHHV